MMEQNALARSPNHECGQSRLSPVFSIPTQTAKAVHVETTTSLLKPALVNSTNARVGNEQIARSNSCRTPSPKAQKPFKQIRFNLENGNTSKDDSWLTPTPPPKDFKRMGTQRRTMLPPRSERCMSTAITQKELQEAFLFGKPSFF